MPLLLSAAGNLTLASWDDVPDSPGARTHLAEVAAQIPPASAHTHDAPGWVRDEDDWTRFTIDIPAALGLPAKPLAA